MQSHYYTTWEDYRENHPEIPDAQVEAMKNDVMDIESFFFETVMLLLI